jgi:Tol biopolymer transport system component
MPLSAGDKLGPYEITAPIGAGGMGEVYRARDMRLKRDVALKVLPAEVARDHERRQRFEQEARAVAALNHPNIVAIYDVGGENGVLFLVTELVEGRNLKGPMPLDAVLKCAAQIADALQAAHDRGIVHRDLKPGNIMLRADGVVKLLDFGLAKSLPEPSAREGRSILSTEAIGMTQAGTVMGTAAYMSPEQAQGLYVDKRTDIWAFGAVLYELLTGRRPFHGSTLAETLANVLKEEPEWDRVPAQAQRLLRRCLAKDPARRLRDIGDAMELLEAPQAEDQRRGYLPWILAGVSALIAVAALAWMLWSRAPEAETWSGSILAGPEIALDPRPSRDGRLLAFQAIERGLTQVAVSTPESGNWSVLTHNRELGFVNEIAWSRDGASLYFDRTVDVPRGIFSVPVLGGEEKLVLENAITPEVLPDGTLLLYRLNSQRNLQLFRYWPETGRLQDLPVVSRAGVGTPTVHIRATPDGREAVVVGTPLGQEKEPDRLLAVDLNTGVSRPLTPLGVTLDISAATVAHDGKSVIVVLHEDALHRVVSIPLKGSLSGKFAPRTLFTTTINTIWFVDTDSSGSVYISATDRHGEAIRRSETLSSPNPTGPKTTGGEAIAGHINVDGERIVSLPDGRAIVTMRGLGRDRLMALADGRNPAPLVSTAEETSEPMTAAGPSEIAFMMGPPPHTTIGVADTATGRIKNKIPTAKGKISSIASSPDGKTLYFSAGGKTGGKIWSVSSAGGEPSLIRSGDGVIADPSGRSLVVSTVESAKVSLFRVPLDGTLEHEIATDGSIPLAPVSPGLLSADGRLLVVLAPLDSWFWVPGILDTNTGRITRLPTDQASHTRALNWTPDGQIVEVRESVRSTLWRFQPMENR